VARLELLAADFRRTDRRLRQLTENSAPAAIVS
jgi:hypothetical protein